MEPQKPQQPPLNNSWKPQLKLTSSDRYVQLAKQYQELGDIDAAIQLYREAIFYYPKLCEAYGDLGHIYEKQGDWTKAQRTYQQGQAMGRSSPDQLSLFNQALARLKVRTNENEQEQKLSHLIYSRLPQGNNPARGGKPPKIAIIILNLNGAKLLSQLFQSIQSHNTYQEIELIIIDHGSSDQSHAVCVDWSNSLPIRFFNRHQNFSFSDSNNFAVAQTDAPLLLFLNNDVLFCEDVLSQLVLLLQDESVGIVGVKFLQYRPSNSFPKREDIQHLGVHFSVQPGHGLLRPYEIQGSQSFQPISSTCWQVPAVSGAFLLCRQADFMQVNGFDEGYFYGYEDVDLCLSFQKYLGKSVICSNQTQVYHHQSYTRKNSEDFKRQRQTNHGHLGQRFGYFIRRSYLTAFFDQPYFWTGTPLCIGFTIPSPGDKAGQTSLIKSLGAYLSRQFGWQVQYISEKSNPPGMLALDILVVTCLDFNWSDVSPTKPTLHTVFWLLQTPAESLTYKTLWNYHSVWLSSPKAMQNLGQLLAKPIDLVPIQATAKDLEKSSQTIFSALSQRFKFTFRVGIKIAAPRWDSANSWGDYHFALGLKRALDRQGHTARIDVRSEWHTDQSLGDDVVIVLRGLKAYQPNPSQINILWHISHPETVEPAEFDAYDYIFVASIPYAEQLSQKLHRHVEPLLQCTDPELFYRDLDKRLKVGPIIFVGNVRKVYRPIVKQAVEKGLRVDVYGQGWEAFIPAEYIQQRHIPNHRLRHYYSGCRILLNDHWDSMRQHGFLSNRLFDAAACGATIISDQPVGLETVFGESVITYQDGADLSSIVNTCLQNRPNQAVETAERAKTMRQEHSFDRRAERILAVINQLHSSKMGQRSLGAAPTPVRDKPPQLPKQGHTSLGTIAQVLPGSQDGPRSQELETIDQLLQQAMDQSAEGRWPSVIQLCQRVQQRAPEHGESYHLLGDAYYNLGDTTQAIHAYGHAIRYQPEAAWSYYNLGRALGQQKTWPDAISAYQSAFRLSAELPHLSHHLTHALEQQAIAENQVGLAAFYRQVNRSDGSPKNHLEQAKFTLETLGKIELENFLISNSTISFPQVENPEISIILILFNRAELTLKCLQAIEQNICKDYEVIIIDNHSTDQTRPLLKQLRNAKIVLNSENSHFLLACNQASQLAQGDYLLLLNNDTQILGGSLTTALGTMKSAPDVGAVGGMIILPDGTLQEAGSIIWQNGSCQGYGRGDSPEAFGYQFRRAVDYCSAAFLLTPRQLFLELGGFDPLFQPAYYEEVDYCVRLLQRGKRVIFEPRIKLIHYEFASSKSSASSGEAITLQQQNHQKFVQKHSDWLRSQYARNSDHILWARSRDRKRILFIEDRIPHPFLGSGLPRAHKILLQMVQAEYFVTFYPLAKPAQRSEAGNYADIPPEVEIVFDYQVSQLGEFLASRENYYDIIWVSRPHNLKHVNNARSTHKLSLANTQIIYDAEAIFCLREFAQLRLMGKPPTATTMAAKLRRELSLSTPHCHTVVAVCKQEQQLFIQHGHKNVERLGHALNVHPTPAPHRRRHNILFVGAVYSLKSPNADAIIWFVNHILAKIQADLGAALTLDLVGIHSIDIMPQLAPSGLQRSVRRLGKVADLSTIYDQYRLFVAPTRFAAGIPHKVHEAAAHGLPIVTTPLMAQQLAWQHGVDLLVAKGAEAFSRRCIQLYQDEALWTRLRENALKKVKGDCSPQNFAEKLTMILRNAYSSKGSG